MRPQELASFLESWPDVWRHPDVWSAVVSTDIDPREVARAYLKHLVCPTEPLDVARTLVERGAFSAAQKLLDHDAFRDSAGDNVAEIERIEERLRTQRLLVQGDLLARWDELVGRSARVGLAIAESDPRFEELRTWSTRDSRRARDLLVIFEREIAGAETQRASEMRAALREVMDAQAAVSDDVSTWAEAVERALTARQFDIAETLLGTGPQGIVAGDEPPLPPRPRPWTFGADAGEVCGWALDGKGGPPEFYALWDAWHDDDIARRLVASMAKLCTGAPVAADEVTHLATSLDRLLGAPASGSSVLPVSGGYRTLLHGLHYVACPAFNGNSGVPFFVEPRGQRIDPTSAPRRGAAVLLSGNPDAGRDHDYLVLTPRDILRCLQRPRDFRLNILRILCAQLAPAELLPTPVPLRDPRAFAGRRNEREEVRRGLLRGSGLLTGAVGVGKTALMLRVLADLEHEGWTTRYVKAERPPHGPVGRSTPLPPDLVTTLSSRAELEAYLEGRRSAGLVLALDDGHEYDLDELRAVLTLSDRLGPRFRLFVAGPPPLADQLAPGPLLPSQVWEIAPLRFGASRTLAGQILDMTGYTATEAALDRLAFHSAGRPALLFALLRELFLEIDESALPRSAVIDLHQVETVYRRPPFREAAWATLLESIEREANLHIVFAATLFVVAVEGDTTRRHASASVDEVRGWLTAESVAISEAQFMRCVNRLVKLNVLSYRDDTRQGLTPDWASGHLIVPLLPDVGDYFNLAKIHFGERAAS